MTTTPQAPQTSQIYGIQLYWTRIRQTKDFFKRAQFRECLGNPAQDTFYKWLKNPGQIPVSKAISLAKYLSKELKTEIEATDLVKPL